ncbi:ABC transporter permease [Xinfangfangia sp. D13-10-4-6]|uniref:ABC transporter permease n=1 Tax=Pseudogemmobacter hezensis TaxID=2737662 RepID=UPI0015523AD8|nr:ABC transporter permease [Pseudogemmobacter hezensis]NPD16762.1 ABC transporter permease [Pseudogemmobacter hezensis]
MADLTAEGADHIAAKPTRHAGQSGFAALLPLAALLAFGLILLVFALSSAQFLRPGNLFQVIAQSSILAVLALGLTVVVIGGGENTLSGGIDLSLAANLGMGAAIYAVLAQAGQPDLLAIPAAILAGLALGAFNAFAIVVLGMLPLLATLGSMTLAVGIEQVVSRNTTILVATPLRRFLGGHDPLFGLPILAWALLLTSLIFALIVHYSRFGLNLQAVGGNPAAARAAGLNTRAWTAGSYLVSGFCGGLGALFSVGFLGASSTGSAEYLLPVIAATFLGTVFSRRLSPTIGGTLLAALFLGVLANGFQLLNISSYWVAGIQGVLMLAVVATTSLRRPL